MRPTGIHYPLREKNRDSGPKVTVGLVPAFPVNKVQIKPRFVTPWSMASTAAFTSLVPLFIVLVLLLCCRLSLIIRKNMAHYSQICRPSLVSYLVLPRDLYSSGP